MLRQALSAPDAAPLGAARRCAKQMAMATAVVHEGALLGDYHCRALAASGRGATWSDEMTRFTQGRIRGKLQGQCVRIVMKRSRIQATSSPERDGAHTPEGMALNAAFCISGCRLQSLSGSAGVNPEAKEAREGVVAKGRRVTFWLQSVSRTEGCRCASSGYAVSSTGVKLVEGRNPRRGLPTVASNMVKATDASTIVRCWWLNDRATDGQAKLRRARIFEFALAEFLARTPRLPLGRLEKRFAD